MREPGDPWVPHPTPPTLLHPQALLEMGSTKERLEAVKGLLENTVKHMAAQAALASAFKGAGAAADDVAPPPGGPD